MKGIFVVGTDTGVGKTVVGCYVAKVWRSRGLTVGAVKPAETGCAPDPADARALAEAAGDARPIEEICPVRLREPLSPMVAAERAGERIEPDRLLAAVAAAGRGRDRVIAEAAGGLLAPYAEGFDGIDLVARSGLPALLVGRLGLGTLNHSRLSVDRLRAAKVKVTAVVLSVGDAAVAPRVGDVAAETNPAVLARLLEDVPVVVFPVVDRRHPARVPGLDAIVL